MSKPKPIYWSVVYTRDSKPLAAFCDFALAEAYAMKAPEMGEQIVRRQTHFGPVSPLEESRKIKAWLAAIVSNDFTVAGDKAMDRAISEARQFLGIK